MPTSRTAYAVQIRIVFLFSFVTCILPVAGCAMLRDAFVDVGAANLTQLVKELDTTLAAFETALIPDDASALQTLAFEALQIARRLLIDKILAQIADLDPEADLSEYQERIKALLPIEPEPD